MVLVPGIKYLKTGGVQTRVFIGENILKGSSMYDLANRTPYYAPTTHFFRYFFPDTSTQVTALLFLFTQIGEFSVLQLDFLLLK